MAEQVLVAGATGGVGQLVVAKLLDKGWSVRALTRSVERVQQMFNQRVEAIAGDIRQPDTLPPAIPDISWIICCTGTTAFPSNRWDFDLPPQSNPLQQVQTWSKIFLDGNYRTAIARNSPDKVDAEGVKNLLNAAPRDLKRFVFVSSCGVERKDQPPYNLLNAFGVLDAKQQGETAILQSGLPYTILRPGRLIDGPYTSYDLNTLIKATTQGKQGIVMGQGDRLNGQTSRIDVANACVECLEIPITANQIFEIINQGSRPETLNWLELFTAAIST
jgi:uncharacterized protein YbjT (DUF2867 family)